MSGSEASFLEVRSTRTNAEATPGITAIAHAVWASLSPAISGVFLDSPFLFGVLFVVAGGLKVVYDLPLFQRFRTLKPPKEHTGVRDLQAGL